MARYKRIWELWQDQGSDDLAGGESETAQFVKKVAINLDPIQGIRAGQHSQVIDGKPYDLHMRYTKELDCSGGNRQTITNEYYFKNGDRELIIHDIMDVNEDSKFLQLLVWEKA